AGPSGTRTCMGPLETSTVTALPTSETVPAGGSVPITRPCAIDALGWDFVAGLKPDDRNRARARGTVRPSTFSTAALLGPLETVIPTRVALATLLPARGLSDTTSPVGTLELAASDATGASPAPFRLATAACSVGPVT